MNSSEVLENQRRVAILGEFRTASLMDFIPSLHSGLNAPRGSKGSAIINHVRVRLARNMPTDIITLDSTISEPISFVEDGLVRVWVVRRRNKNIVRDAFREERLLLHEVLAQSGADVCHANWTYEYGLAAVTQSIMPYILTVRDHSWNILKWYGPKYLGLYAITQWVLRSARFITAVSPYITEYVSRITNRQIPVIPNTLSDLVLSLRKDRTLSENSCPIVVSVLEWSKLKNVKRALQGFQFVRHQIPEIKYWLIGTGLGEKEVAWHWASKHSLTENVSFLGILPYRETLERMSKADILFHPSLEESFGNVVAEAMAMNIPVVATQEARGSRWLLGDGECGYLVSGKSVKDMGVAILDLLNNSNKINNVILNAKNRICNLCDPDIILSKYDHIYREAIKYY